MCRLRICSGARCGRRRRTGCRWLGWSGDEATVHDPINTGGDEATDGYNTGNGSDDDESSLPRF